MSAYATRDSSHSGATYAALIALPILTSATWILLNVAVKDASVGLTVFGRLIFTALGLYLLTVVEKRRHHHRKQQSPIGHESQFRLSQRNVLLLSLTGVVGYTIFVTIAVSLTGAVIPSLIGSTGPLIVLLVESHLHRRRVPPRVLIGTIITVVCTIGFIASRHENVGHALNLWGILFSILSLLSMTAYVVHFSMATSGWKVPMASVILPIYAWSLLPTGVWALCDVIRGERLTFSTLAVLFALGFAIYVPVYLLQHGLLAKIGAFPVSVVGLSITPLVGLSGIILFNNAPWSLCQQFFVIASLFGMIPALWARTHPYTRAQETRAGADNK
ncbi:DMT family transporter [Actinomyces vulturis]|uniref:DMT family transporter n=1 Tax=Actinomyces vulturis TaxID=1857645 RepID=UPI0008367776|nr:DMT family transporter [Actinomyces vulturis]